MIVDALILAGGRSSRLDGVGKQRMVVSGLTLLERTVRAAVGAGTRDVVVVGDDRVDGVVAVREQPAFAGPVAAIAAGLDALTAGSEAVLVLACDMPDVARATPALLAEFAGDGVVAVDRGQRQQLAFLAALPALRRAVAALPTVVDASVRALLAELDLTDVVVPDGTTDDIDTWDDAARHGIVRTTPVESAT